MVIRDQRPLQERSFTAENKQKLETENELASSAVAILLQGKNKSNKERKSSASSRREGGCMSGLSHLEGNCFICSEAVKIVGQLGRDCEARVVVSHDPLDSSC